MSNVVSLEQHNLDQGDHAEGPLICLGCNHKWRGVFPLPAPDVFDCPECGLEKGITEGLFNLPADTEVMECDCGSQRFVIMRDGAFCEMCGTTHEHEGKF